MNLFKRKEMYKLKYKEGESVKYYIRRREYEGGFSVISGKIIKTKKRKYLITSNGSTARMVKEKYILGKVNERSYNSYGTFRIIRECTECGKLTDNPKIDILGEKCNECDSRKLVRLKVIQE